MNYFNYNGKIVGEGTSVIGPDNRGLRYGDGLFETMKIKGGQIIFEDEHFARLWKGLAILQFEIPRHFTADLLQEQIKTLAKKNNHEGHARIRLNLVRGDGGLYDTKSNSPNYIIQSWALPSNTGDWNTNGLVLGFYKNARKSCDTFSNLKNNNFLPYAIAALHAKQEKWNDAILLNTNEHICDTTIANIFLIKDGVVITPSLAEGCVAGVMRKILLKKLSGQNWPVVEKAVSAEDLQNADEVFTTNSVQYLRWVQRVGDVNYRNSLTQKIYTDIIQTIS